MLTYVLAQCDLPQLDNEILYMMELLDPSLLQGEGSSVVPSQESSRFPQALLTPPPLCPGGYYLISVFGAMSLIKNFQEDQAAKVLSCATRDTLHQWHRRRTTILRSAPCIDDFQVEPLTPPTLLSQPPSDGSPVSTCLRLHSSELPAGGAARAGQWLHSKDLAGAPSRHRGRGVCAVCQQVPGV